MKKISFMIQMALCALLAMALWRVVSGWKETNGGALANADKERNLKTRASDNPPSIGTDVDENGPDPSFRQGVLLVPLTRMSPSTRSKWVPRTPHFLIESLSKRNAACVSAVGNLVHVGEIFLRLETGARPARSRLAAFASQAGEMFHFSLLTRSDFRHHYPLGLVPCGEWVDGGSMPQNRVPSVLRMRVGTRRVLASRSLAAVQVVRGNAIALARHPLRDAYEVTAERAGESLLDLTHLPGPHIRNLRIVVADAAPTRASQHVARNARGTRETPPPAPPAPGHGRFLLPGWTSHDR